MSLQKEIESLLMWQDNIQGQDATYQQKASIAINKVLDAVSMECIPGNIDDGNDYLKGWNQALDHTQSVINKLRGES